MFESNAEALVNTVNTVGVMGKGVALQFKERFQDNYRLYKKACEKGEVTIGKMFITSTNSLVNPKWVINFPTKKHWIYRSSYEYIEKGLDDLIRVIKEFSIYSIAIPPIGAGQGGLDWEKIKLIINQKLSGLAIEIEIYEPNYATKTEAQNQLVDLTKPRAFILALMVKYRVLGFDISLIEIQKLAYFLQRIGQVDLKLQFKKYYYGPYAHNLQHLLIRLEKTYFITEKAILDSKPYSTINLKIERIDEISTFIKENCSTEEINKFEIVSNIIKGFESPFGLELLATVDWILNENQGAMNLSSDFILDKIKEWSKRKAIHFTKEHISIAFNHLQKFEKILYMNHNLSHNGRGYDSKGKGFSHEKTTQD